MTTAPSIDPALPEQVAPVLLSYLRATLDAPSLAYAEPPAPLGDGWETYIYSFALAGDGLDPTWTAPLVARIFPNRELAFRAAQEDAIQRFVAARGYPAPRVLLTEPSGDGVGLPLMVMERIDGQTLFERMSANPLASRGLIPKMAQAHAALHRLPLEKWPLPAEGPLVERQHAGFRERIQQLGLDDLDKELGWLEANKAAVLVEERSICHGDFHPNNVMATGEDELRVIDWAGATIGDRHYDLAATLVVMRTAPAPEGGFWARLLDRFGRGMFIRRYLRSYRRELPIDKDRLRYWEAQEAFEWLVRVSGMAKLGSAAYGIRADAAERLPPGQLETLRRYFWSRAR